MWVGNETQPWNDTPQRLFQLQHRNILNTPNSSSSGNIQPVWKDLREINNNIHNNDKNVGLVEK